MLLRFSRLWVLLAAATLLLVALQHNLTGQESQKAHTPDTQLPGGISDQTC
jgi:hypothetical protein